MMMALRLVPVALLGVGLLFAVGCRDGASTSERGVVMDDRPPGATATPVGPRTPVVVLDPGHGGPEIGAANHGVVEKESNLDMALRVERLLRDAGIDVVLTRRADARANADPADDRDEGADGAAGTAVTFGATRADLQRRVDIANDAAADLFVSIHSNGSTDPSLRGVEVYYDPDREFADKNERFAGRALDGIVAALGEAGYAVNSRGVLAADCIRVFNGRCFPLFVLGPPRTYTREQLVARGVDPAMLGMADGVNVATTRATAMPGILVELLAISNAQDAAILADPNARDAMARGLADAVLAELAD